MGKTFAVIDCSIPINTRNQKIINSLKENYPDSEIHVITWNREGIVPPEDRFFHAYDYIAPYADAKAKLKGMFGFRNYIGIILKSIKADVIIASHWSNLILVSGFVGKKQMLIYENLDIPTGGQLVRKVSEYLERRSLKKTDMIIHASRFFRKLYPQRIPQIVLENKPAFAPNLKQGETTKPLRISFIGSIRYKDILMNLADAVKNNDNFELYFHGSGEDLSAMQEYCKDCNNVFFTGKYDYSTVITHYHNSDIIWAGYPNKDYNVVYAISNKFHESLYVGVPCVYSSDTELADFVSEKKLGFVVDPYSVESIAQLFNDINNGKISLNEVRESMINYQKTEKPWNEDFKSVVTEINNYFQK